MRGHLIAFIKAAQTEFAEDRHRSFSVKYFDNYMEYRLDINSDSKVSYWDAKFGDDFPEEMEVEAAVDRMLGGLK